LITLNTTWGILNGTKCVLHLGEFGLCTAYNTGNLTLSKWRTFCVWIGRKLSEDSWWRVNSLESWDSPTLSIQRRPFLQTCTIGSFSKLGGLLIWWHSNHIDLLCDSGNYWRNARVDSDLMYWDHEMGLRHSLFWVIAVPSSQLSNSQRPAGSAETTRIPGNVLDVTSCPYRKTGTMSLRSVKRWLSAGFLFVDCVALT
jgi:hypothetical protein